MGAGGLLWGERINPENGDQVDKGRLSHGMPVQEAFVVRQPLLDQIVIGGTSGNYAGVYSFIKPNTPDALMAPERPSIEEPAINLPTPPSLNPTNARRVAP